MKLFITGASGFVGGAIVNKLAHKHTILAMSRSESSDARIKGLGAKPVRGSLDNLEGIDLTGVDCIVHCAAFVGPWGSRKDFFKGNVEGTRALLDAASQAGVRRFIHMGTEAALFRGQNMHEIDETYPYPARTPYLYSESKGEAERLVLNYESGMERIVLRPRFVWGPGDTSVRRVLKQMVDEGKFMWIGGGTALTSTTYIDNLVHAVELALTAGRSGRAYFITDGENRTFKEFLTAMMDTQGVRLPEKKIPAWLASTAARLVEGSFRMVGAKSEPPLMRFPTDLMGRECTIRIDRARQELGYEPIVTVENGMQALRAEVAN
ncbi:MAG: 3-beta hydroxysteroid dehydrogenase [Spirochaetaceae bacterium]|nr:3-beta hydroxysteroid dehydrogenase [Spirochaetaceae bacterium]|tara:strand:- start:115152 stop:116117 length:966 start_codon:yes stop_codon:yes gene_type:complete